MMNSDELKRMWENAKVQDLVSFNREGLPQQLDASLRKFESDIKGRNNREIYIALALMPVFLVIAIFIQPLLARISALLVIPYCILVIYMIRRVQNYKVTDTALPLKYYLLRYREYLQKEKRMLQNVAYWYISPMVVITSLFFIGLQRYWFIIITVAVAIFVYRLNMKAVKEYFPPLLEKIDNEIEELTHEE